MTRPEIIRADSIDLQDQDRPSAKEHHRPAPTGPVAPHQAETLREIAQETAEENLRSPRVSWANGDAGDLQQYAEDLAAGVTNSLGAQDRGREESRQNGSAKNKMQGKPQTQSQLQLQQQQQQQDALAIAQNGGVSGQDVDDGDMDDDTDGDMDDDMMDKISSSPSIEDGVYIRDLRASWPHRVDSLQPVHSPTQPSSPVHLLLSEFSDVRSSSPYLDHPDYLPLDSLHKNHQWETDAGVMEFLARHHHHLQSEYRDHDPVEAADELSPALSNEEGEATDPRSSKTTLELGDGLSKLEPELSAEVKEVHVARDTSPAASSVVQYKGRPEPAGDVSGFDSDDSDLEVPYEAEDDDDDDDDDEFTEINDSRSLDSGWGGECLQDTEDIDFEFVYALHTFVATVEGQANATKGDTMVLLDDSNSYWWLVRVVKDSSIGYLPAEHIETPTERLARLNKHRNIDLSATMLGDQAEKPRNPLKSALKKRKKTVAFAAPTYVDYENFDYSTEEEEDLEAEYLAQQQQQQQGQQTQQASAQQAATEREAEDETAKVEPLRPRAQSRDATSDPAKTDSSGSDSSLSKGSARSSEEIFETKSGDGPKKTSDGTVRDSFFKDETVETKKITLTPNLLRDDTTPRTSAESKDLKPRPSFDKLDKENALAKDKKKDKREKDKKPSAIRSFFSRKDKKKSAEDDDESFGKRSMDAGSEMQEKDYEDEEPQPSPEKAAAAAAAPAGPQRMPSKLQKQQPRAEPSPTRKPGAPGEKQPGMDLSSFLNESRVNGVANVPPATMRVVEADPQDALDSSPLGTSRDRSPEASRRDDKTGASRVAARDVKPQKVKPAKQRLELDDFDSMDEEITPEPIRPAPVPDDKMRQQQQQQLRPTLPGAYPDSYLSSQTTSSVATEKAVPPNSTPPQQSRERLSESPVEVSPANSSNPPPLMIDSSSQEEDQSSRATPSPELVEHEDADMHGKQDSITTSTSNTTTSTWNDTNLRAFFDSGSDIRDLLAVVYDTSDVDPVGPDHPVAGTLFREQNARLAEITTQLDNMLGDWLARKQRLRGTV